MEKQPTLRILEVSKLVKRFGGVTAVSGVNLTLERGSIVGLIGPNGAGKTTFFNCITGLATADGGRISFGDYQDDVTRLEPHRIARLGISRTFQNIRLFKGLSALENVMIGAHTKTRSRLLGAFLRTRRAREEERQVRKHAEELCGFVGLKNHLTKTAGEMSFGHQRLLEIARALASGPTLLLLDEPAAGMNPQEKQELLALIRRIRERGVSLLVIEHDMKFLMPISDKVVVMDYGVKIAEGTPETIQRDPRVIEAYLGKGATHGA